MKPLLSISLLNDLNLDPFYKKYINVNGIHLLSSHWMPVSALYAAYRTLAGITALLPEDVLKAMTGLNATRPDINKQLKAALDDAKAKGKWQRTYAATNIAEYWAEGVQDWFGVNAEVKHPDGKHNFVNTRKELRKYDKGLYDIVASVFPENKKPVSCHCFTNKYHKE